MDKSDFEKALVDLQVNFEQKRANEGIHQRYNQ